MFVNSKQIETNFQPIFADLQTYLTDAHETAILYKIMGKTEADLLIADLDASGDPQSAKWIAIFSDFNFVTSNISWNCIGVKEILKYFVYSEYVGGQSIVNSIAGNVTQSFEASSPEQLIKKADVIWNRAARNVDILQYYMSQNSTDYPNLISCSIEYNSPI